MEEKKLTDEEIVKALECCTDEENVDCENCPLVKEPCAIIRKYALDFIHRLQAENEQLKCNSYRTSWKAKFLEAKKEIERLTEEHERIAWSKQQYLDWVHGFLSTHTDMKDRGEDYKMFDLDWMCGVFWAKIEGSIEYIIDLEKQVDELKDERENMQAEILRFEDMKFTQEHCDLYSENETLKQWLKRLNADLEYEKNWGKQQTKQAVKDTAKKICDLILEHWEKNQFVECDWLRVAISEKYGVEVE